MILNHQGLLQLIEDEQEMTYRGANPSFRQIARDTGTVPSTFTRLRAKKDMSAEALLSLVVWLNARGNSYAAICSNIIAKPARRRA